MVGALSSDNPQAYLPGDRRRALAEGRTLPDRVHGSVVFADIFGFTALTEALSRELGPQRGAEELTSVLDAVVGALLEEVDRFGGDAIYFSGDAITCWLDGDDGRGAVACALGLQQVMGDVGTRTTLGGRHIELALKVAIAVGPARRFVVGDPAIQLIDVLAGALMDRLAAPSTWPVRARSSSTAPIWIDCVASAWLRRSGRARTATLGSSALSLRRSNTRHDVPRRLPCRPRWSPNGCCRACTSG